MRIKSINTEQEEIMWQEYFTNRNKGNRDRLILYYKDFLSMIAGKMYNHFGTKVEFGDLLGDGAVGLINAVEKFDLAKGDFKQYAALKIRGAILDGHRARDWKKRRQRQKEKKNLEEYKSKEIVYLQQMLEDMKFEPAAKDNVEDIAAARLTKKDIILKIKNAIKELTEREQKVIILYFMKSITAGGIAPMLGLCESRISQIKNGAIKKLATKLSGEKASILSCLE